MSDAAPTCSRCDKEATVHLTELVDGAYREVHYCEDHAHDQGFHVPIKRAEPWCDDDRHATLEVTRAQLESGETLVGRFGDGTELRLPGYEPTPQWKVIEIKSVDGPKELPRLWDRLPPRLFDMSQMRRRGWRP